MMRCLIINYSDKKNIQPIGQSIIILVIILNVISIFAPTSCVQHHQVYRREKRPDRLKFEIERPVDCSVIGHPNATLNECGYCVGQQTNLDFDHGKDCQGGIL